MSSAEIKDIGDEMTSTSGPQEKALSRIQKLLKHGVSFTPRLSAVRDLFSKSTEDETTVAVQRLGAALLDKPVKVALQAFNRDFHTELAISKATLDALGIQPGTFVQIRSSNQENSSLEPAHVARVWAIQSDDNNNKGLIKDDVAYLAPGLAHNLRLSLHLWPLLQGYGDEEEDDVDEQSDENLYYEHVFISPYRKPQSANKSNSNGTDRPSIVDIPIPEGKSVQIPLATEVDIAFIRIPMQDPIVVPPASEEEEGGGGGEQPSPLDKKEDQAVEALQEHFIECKCFLCQGDIIVVEKRHGSPMAGVNSQMVSEGGQAEPPEDHLFLKVEKLVSSSGKGPAAIDPTTTVIRLHGHSCGSLPVGVTDYLTDYLESAGAAAQNEEQDDDGGKNNTVAIGSNSKLLVPGWKDMATLLASALHPGNFGTHIRLAILLHGPSGSGKQTALTAALNATGCHQIKLDCKELNMLGMPERKVIEGIHAAFSAAGEFNPTVLVLQHFQALAGCIHNTESFASRIGNALSAAVTESLQDKHGKPKHAHVVLVAICPSADDLPAPLRRCFTHELLMETPSQAVRQETLQTTLRHAKTTLTGDEWEELARQTAGLLPRDLKAVVADACAHVVQDEKLPALDSSHIHQAVDNVRQRMATEIGAPKIPDVRWEDVGGLEDVKLAILDTIELPLKHPSLFSNGLRRRSGVLLYGPPGTGKTLLAKAVATECSINFMSVKGPELINMYVGESERQIREVFARARRARPCVIFFDELDSLAPSRGKGSDSGGVMDRVVSQLLAEIDGVQGGGSEDIFIIGATNRPDLLDPALLRPGRLDRLLYVGITTDKNSRHKVLLALTRKFKLEDVDLEDIADKCQSRMTGADLYALCSDAWMTAFKRAIEEGNKTAVVSVSQRDFSTALKSLQPSLSQQEVDRYETIRKQYQNVKG